MTRWECAPVTIGFVANIGIPARGVLIACLALLLVVLVASVLVVYVRRRWIGGSEGNVESWTLSDLRRLRDEGRLSAEEFEAMRTAMIRAVKGENRDAGVRIEPQWDWTADPPPTPDGDEPGTDFDLENSPRG